VSVDELVGLALCLDTPVALLLDPRGLGQKLDVGLEAVVDEVDARRIIEVVALGPRSRALYRRRISIAGWQGNQPKNDKATPSEKMPVRDDLPEDFMALLVDVQRRLAAEEIKREERARQQESSE
jgi:hypothetical protein